jgi:hypothetical protein
LTRKHSNRPPNSESDTSKFVIEGEIRANITNLLNLIAGAIVLTGTGFYLTGSSLAPMITGLGVALGLFAKSLPYFERYYIYAQFGMK